MTKSGLSSDLLPCVLCMSHYSGIVSGSMSFDSTPVFSTFSVFYTPVISALCTFVSMFSFARSFFIES